MRQSPANPIIYICIGIEMSFPHRYIHMLYSGTNVSDDFFFLRGHSYEKIGLATRSHHYNCF